MDWETLLLLSLGCFALSVIFAKIRWLDMMLVRAAFILFWLASYEKHGRVADEAMLIMTVAIIICYLIERAWISFIWKKFGTQKKGKRK